MAITIDITDRATPLLNAVRGRLRDGSMEEAMGAGATRLIKDHLVQYNSAHPNQLGGPRTNFYASAARATSYRSKPGEITISINHVGLRQRWQGGHIRPTGGRKYLTIPAVPEAHGKRASEFNNLRFGFTEGRFGGLVPALVEASATRVTFGRRRQDGSRKVTNLGGVGGRALFFLAKKVFQRGDPSVLPTEAAIGEAAVQAGATYIAAQVQKGGKA